MTVKSSTFAEGSAERANAVSILTFSRRKVGFPRNWTGRLAKLLPWPLRGSKSLEIL